MDNTEDLYIYCLNQRIIKIPGCAICLITDQLVTSDNIEKMRGLADSAKLYLSTDTHTINLWPAAIFSLIALLGEAFPCCQF